MFEQAWMPCCRTCTVLVLLYVQLPVISKSTDTDVTGACGGDSDLHTEYITIKSWQAGRLGSLGHPSQATKTYAVVSSTYTIRTSTS